MPRENDDGSFNVRIDWVFRPMTEGAMEDRQLHALEFIADALGELVEEVKAAKELKQPQAR